MTVVLGGLSEAQRQSWVGLLEVAATLPEGWCLVGESGQDSKPERHDSKTLIENRVQGRDDPRPGVTPTFTP